MIQTLRFFTLLLLAVPALAAETPALPEWARPGAPVRGGRYPALSPDGSSLALGYMGDLWVVPSAGGEARRLTSTAAYERSPVWSPDGKWICYAGNLHGNYDLYVIPSQGGQPRRLTWHSAQDLPQCFSPDGKWIYYVSGRDNGGSVYAIPVGGGIPKRHTRTFWNRATHVAVSPDGASLLLNLGDQASSFWWRVGYRGSNSSDVWRFDLVSGRYTRWTSWNGDDLWPQWAPDGRTFYYVSDREGRIPNLYRQVGAEGVPEALTHFTDDAVRFPSVDAGGRLAAYEHAFGIWTTDLKTGESREVPIRAGADYPLPLEEQRTLTRDASEVALSPDGRKLAIVVRGDVFVLPSDGGETRPVSTGPARDRYVQWTPDSRSLVYVSDASGEPEVTVVAADGSKPARTLTSSPGEKGSPVVTPDGRTCVFYAGASEIRTVALAGGPEQVLVRGQLSTEVVDGPTCAVSPDGSWLAYAAVNATAELELHLVPMAGGVPTNITRAGHDSQMPVWSRDGKYLYFTSNRKGHDIGVERQGNYEIFRVPMVPDSARFSEDKLDSLFLPEAARAAEKPAGKPGERPAANPAPPRPMRVDLAGIERRFQRIVESRGDCVRPSPSPDGKTVAFLSNVFGPWQVFTVSAEGGRPRQVSQGEGIGFSFPDGGAFQRPAVLQWDKEGKKLYFQGGGAIRTLTVPEGAAAEVGFAAKVQVQGPGEYRQMFREAWTTLRDWYYDEHHHGVDWAAVGAKYEARAAWISHPFDFADNMKLMMGELNSSHTGANPPAVTPDQPTAYLGCELDAPAAGVVGARISRRFVRGPLDQPNAQAAEGEYVLAVDGHPLDASARDDAWLSDRVGRRIRLLVGPAPVAGAAWAGPATPGVREVLVKGLDAGESGALRYADWCERRKARARALSGDRVVYIHLRAAGQADIDKYRRELSAEGEGKRGLLLDVRWNSGGSIDQLLLTDLAQRRYQTRTARGFNPRPTPSFAWGRPSTMLINEVTLSNGEVIANGYRELGLGKLVGNTTYGWLIGTFNRRLVDGSVFRVPVDGLRSLKGEDMETWGGVKPDVSVMLTPEQDSSDEDPQLDKALEVLQAELK